MAGLLPDLPLMENDGVVAKVLEFKLQEIRYYPPAIVGFLERT
jgi:hypothetical protein